MRILVLGDPHLPAPDWALLWEAARFNRKYRAHKVVCAGDLTDQKTWSRFGRDSDDPGNDEEWANTLKAARRFERLFPKMEIIIGNHDIRYFKAASLVGIPSQLVRTLKEALPIEGWSWHDTSRGPLLIDGVGYVHGDEESGGALVKACFLGYPIVQGHDHKGLIAYAQAPQKKTPIWGMSVGCTADRSSQLMRYSAKRLKKAFSCFATVTDGIPQIYPKGST